MNEPWNLQSSDGRHQHPRKSPELGGTGRGGSGGRTSRWRTLVFAGGFLVVGLIVLSLIADRLRGGSAGEFDRASLRPVSKNFRLVGTSTGDPNALPVEVMRVEKVDRYVRNRAFTGVVKPTRESRLSFERLGKVKEVSADVGDRVAAGQTLGRIDDRRLRAKRDGLVAQKQEALAILAELKAGPRKQTIDAQRATVADLKAQVDGARQLTQRRQRLLQSSASSRESAEQSAFSLAAVQARLQSAQSGLDELLAGTRKEKIDAQEATVKRLDAMVADVDIEIDESRLQAPYDALVIERAVDEGSIAQPGETVFCIIEDASVEIWVGVPTQVASSVKPGDEIDVTVRDKAYRGKVRSLIADLDNETLTQTVILTLKNITLDQIIPGEVARASLGQEIRVDGFWIPISAISRGGQGLWSVLAVLKDDADQLFTQLRDVELIETAGERVLVRGSLADGETIISNGTHRLAPNQAVRIADGAASQEAESEDADESESPRADTSPGVASRIRTEAAAASRWAPATPPAHAHQSSSFAWR